MDTKPEPARSVRDMATGVLQRHVALCHYGGNPMAFMLPAGVVVEILEAAGFSVIESATKMNAEETTLALARAIRNNYGRIPDDVEAALTAAETAAEPVRSELRRLWVIERAAKDLCDEDPELADDKPLRDALAVKSVY